MQESITKSELLTKLGNYVTIRPIISPRSGEAVRNQTAVIFENGSLFQSYDTIIGVRTGGKLYLSEQHDCSVTTSKWCKEWCGYNAKERRDGLKSGRFLPMIND